MRKPPPLNDLFKYPVTAGVVLLSAAMSLAWWSRMDIDWALMSPLIFEGQIWRLFTSIFPHLEVFHLGFNLYWLWVFGTLIEPTFGGRKFAGIILFLAIGSCLAEYTVSAGGVGLSGVGYGLFGMTWVLSRTDDRFKKAVDPPTVLLFLVWFLFCIFLTYKGLVHVGNMAHGAGLVLGFLLGWRITWVHRPLVPTLLMGGFLFLAILGAIAIRSYLVPGEVAAAEQAHMGYHDLLAGRYAAARERLRLSLDLDERNADVWSNLGIACERLGNLDEAVEAYQKAFDRKETQDTRTALAKALVTLGARKQQENHHQEASILLQKAVTLDRGNAYSWYNLGVSLYSLGQQEQALAAFREAWKKDPGNPAFQEGFRLFHAEVKE